MVSNGVSIPDLQGLTQRIPLLQDRRTRDAHSATGLLTRFPRQQRVSRKSPRWHRACCDVASWISSSRSWTTWFASRPVSSWWLPPCSFGACSPDRAAARSEEHTSALQSHVNLVCRLLLEKKKQ